MRIAASDDKTQALQRQLGPSFGMVGRWRTAEDNLNRSVSCVQVNRLAPRVFRKAVPGFVQCHFHKLVILLFAFQFI